MTEVKHIVVLGVGRVSAAMARRVPGGLLPHRRDRGIHPPGPLGEGRKDRRDAGPLRTRAAGFEGLGTLEAFNTDDLRSLIKTFPGIQDMKE